MRWILAVLVMSLTLATSLHAEDDPRLPLDELLATPISTAAKYEQNLSAAAASATIITAEDIERYGWTTLDQALRAVRGFFVTYDRAYSYIGLRGISRPADYNARILLMVNDQPTNGYVFGDALAGTALALDLDSVERIEIVRGPGSALFGSHAMMGVINIITKGADTIDGFGASLIAGSQGKQGASIHAGKTSDNGFSFAATGYWQETNGDDLYFPEYDAPETNNGVAENRDYDDLRSFSLMMKYGNLRVGLISREREKGVPTGFFRTDFNADAWVSDRTDTLSAQYTKSVGVGKQLFFRAWSDRTAYEGLYPYGEKTYEKSLSQSNGGEVRFRWDLRSNHRVTVGSEYIDVRRAEYEYEGYRFNRPFDAMSFYVQDEYQPTETIALTVGLRQDSYSHASGSLSPRAGVVFSPNDRNTFKLLYGKAFRIASVYELDSTPSLQPETIRSLELVWEKRLSPLLFGTAAIYDIHADRIIHSTGNGSFENMGTIISRGTEVGVELRRPDGLWSHLSYTLQTGRDDDGQPLVNAPQHMITAGVSTSPWQKMHGGLEAIYESSRRTLNGGMTDGFVILNGTIARRLVEGLKLAVSAENLFDTRYSLPVGSEIRGNAIRQDGRSFTVRLAYER
ncbi:MAG TPA: TonB-dependent receptor [Thermoanaerobaculia bacterium]|jgi:iron complex outermembrane receptor protein|nr:TonB-dependent receptor [Thermoanaerobaculia bacterium]